MAPSNINKEIMLACVLVVMLSTVGFTMDCTTTEEEQMCQTNCQSKGFNYGRCDYSDCTCYGRASRPNGGALVNVNGPMDGSLLTRQRPVAVLPINTIPPTGSSTSSGKKKPLVCSSSIQPKNEKAISSYDECLSWCQQSSLDIYIVLDNLCCCQRT